MSEIPASTVRRYVDGELEADEASRLERRAETDERIAGQIRFERALRERISTVVGTSVTPVDLEARVRRAIRDAPPEPAARRSWLTGPTKANFFAVAASLALVAGAVLFGMFGRQIDSRPDVSEVSEVAQFVAGEHQRCAGRAAARGQKVQWHAVAEAEAGLEATVGRPVRVPDLSDIGFRFVGAGKCGIPGQAASAHMIYARERPAEDGCPEAMLSLFVVPDAGQFTGTPVATGDPWTWSKIGDRPSCSKQVACATDGAVYVFLVCCDESKLADLATQISRRARPAPPDQS